MEITLGFALELRDWIAILASIVSIVSVATSVYVYRRARSITLYSDIDRLYLELLKLGIEHPTFVDPQYTENYETSFRDPEERTKYELYAFIAWNICETIVDRKDNKLTFASWEPVLKFESNLHRAWFENEVNQEKINQKKFKRAFKDYIEKRRNQIKT
jgi:hypothetical protein